MKRNTTIKWLLIILICTTMLEVYTIAVQGFSDKPFIRIVLLAFLFFLTIKGVQWARFLLASLYILGGVIGINAFASNPPSLNTWILGGFGIFCVLASVFIVMSKYLGTPTTTKENQHSTGLSL